MRPVRGSARLALVALVAFGGSWGREAQIAAEETPAANEKPVAGDTFDDAKAKQAAGQRVATAERLRDAVTGALGRLHALLDKDQRERLAYLIRTGVLAV